MSTKIYGHYGHPVLAIESQPKARELQALYDRIEKLEESLKYVEDMLNEEIRRKDSRSD